MYLKANVLYLVLGIIWFYLGIRRMRRVPLVHDPLLAFSRYHRRLTPFVVLLLILFWPVNRWVWRLVFYSTLRLEQFDRRRKSK
jgi:hypothetical protein